MKTNLLAPILCALLLAACAGCNPGPQPAPQPTVDAGPGPDPSPTPVPPAPTPTVVVDAGPAPTPPAPSSPEAAACDNLARAGCPEGENPSCPAVLLHAETSGITKVNLPCLTSQKTQAALRACGFVKCQP